MRRTLATLLLIGAAVALLAGIFPRQPAQPTIQITTVDPSAYPTVRVQFRATDPSGQPLTAIDASQLVLREHGQVAPIERLDPAFASGAALSTVLLLDSSPSMAAGGKLPAAKAAAHAFIAQLRPGDQVALIGFDSQPRVLRRFDDRQAALDAAVDALRPGGGSAVYDAAVRAVELLRDQPGRRAVVLLTDGQDCRNSRTDGCQPEFGSQTSLDGAILTAARAGQPITVVGLGDPLTLGAGGIDERGLAQLATETGGRYLGAPQPQQLAAVYARLGGELRQGFELTYTSRRPLPDAPRQAVSLSVAPRGPQPAPLLLSLLLIGVGAWLLARRPVQDLPPHSTAGSPTVQLHPAHCTSCDTPLPPGARFCDQCGARVR